MNTILKIINVPSRAALINPVYKRILMKTIMNKFKWILTIILFACSSLNAQVTQSVIRGKVTYQGQPLPGASVELIGTSNSTFTFVDGTYAMSVSSLEGTLLFSFKKHRKKIEINGQTEINAELDPNLSPNNQTVIQNTQLNSVSADPIAKNDAVAMFNKGVQLKGNNDIEAFNYFQKAADLGNVDSYYFLGSYYESGEGGEQNYSKAVDWFIKGAEKGDSYSQYRLGLCYQRGNGIGQDLNQAKVWFKYAADKGHERAKQALLELNNAQGSNNASGLNQNAAQNTQINPVQNQRNLPSTNAIANEVQPAKTDCDDNSNNLIKISINYAGPYKLIVLSIENIGKKPIRGTIYIAYDEAMVENSYEMHVDADGSRWWPVDRNGTYFPVGTRWRLKKFSVGETVGEISTYENDPLWGLIGHHGKSIIAHPFPINKQDFQKPVVVKFCGTESDDWLPVE
ncbi:MAG TPA: hypothetical protein DGG95_15610 [Cytophagales bacterium]|jgi:hypothetical protein|nr:hypothetical protein [Cytophagales bacterium]